VRGLVLTGQEKRIILFVVIAFLLGLAVKTYRETHSPTKPAVQAVKKSHAKQAPSDD